LITALIQAVLYLTKRNTKKLSSKKADEDILTVELLSKSFCRLSLSGLKSLVIFLAFSLVMKLTLWFFGKASFCFFCDARTAKGIEMAQKKSIVPPLLQGFLPQQQRGCLYFHSASGFGTQILA